MVLAVGLSVPLRVRLVAAVRTAPVAPVLDQVIGVANADCAGRQEVTGRLRFTGGSTEWTGEIEDGPRPRVRPPMRGVADAIRLFGAAVSAVLDTPIDEIWAGLIDQTPDALPVLQSVAEPSGLVIAMGFSGRGFCLGPVTGQIAAAMAQNLPVDLPLEPFALACFDRWNTPSAPVTLHG